MRNGHRLTTMAAAALAIAAGAARASAAVTFETGEAARRYAAYTAFLERDPERYAPELRTVRQLEASEVEYHVRVGGDFRTGVDGELTTDGERVFVNVSDGSGANGRGAAPCSRFSERSCFAHELEHARQFDDGEFAFERDPASGRWHAERPSFDIGDEMRAWLAQARLATNEDFWRRPEGSAVARPSLLAKFAAARTDAERIRVLGENGYGELYAVPNCVWSPPVDGLARGLLVRPRALANFFGRVPR
jgi:hypothetical protein